MKFIVAITLVIVTVATAESPNQRATFQKQTDSAPYQPRGWRPNGPGFDPTLRLQNQQQAPPGPSPSYGPPPSASYGPPPSEVATTEEPTTTESDIEPTTVETQAENFEIGSTNNKLKSDKLQKESQTQPGDVYVILPQGQSLIYAAPLTLAKAAPLTLGKAAPLTTAEATSVEEKTPNKDVELVKEPKLAPVQAIPALAKIRAPLILAKYEQVPQLLQLQQIQEVPFARYIASLSQTSVYTPYSSSFVHVYQ